MTEFLNTLSEHWYDWQIDMLWQVTVLIAIIWGVDVLIRKWAWPQVRYALWMLVLVKLLIPPTFTSPASITSHIPAVAEKAISIEFNTAQTETTIETLTANESLVTTPVESATDNEWAEPVAEGQNTIAGDGPVAAKQSKGGILETSVPLQTSPNVAIQSSILLTWKIYAMFIWLAGILVLSAWLILRLTGLRREHIKQDSAFQLPQRFTEQLEVAAQKLNLKKLPRVILTDKVRCPAVFGVFRPVLLMPAEKFKTMTTRDTEHVLLHELAHIKRGDLFIHAVYMILQIAYWFNPLLWIIRRIIQNLRELCCDATVAKLLREDTVHYRQTLLDTARQLLAEPVNPGLGLLGLFENSNWLVTRLQWLEKKTWKNRKLRITVIVLLIAFMAACVLPMAVFNPGTPDFVIRGTVNDAQTGQPVVGAKVGDNKRYNKGEFCTVTDSDGHYEYKTWYEEHGTIAEADGYKSQLKGFNTKIFGSEKEKVINFELVPVTVITIEQVMKQADNEARQLNHEYIGTEHLLLALVSDENTYAYVILKDLGVNTKKVPSEITKLIKSGTDPVTKEKLPLTPRAEKALEYAEDEAKSLNQDTIRSEHMLLGLLRVEDGVAAGVLENMGVRYDDVYQEIIHSGNKGKVPQNIEGNTLGTDLSNGIFEAVLLPEHFKLQTVLSLKTGRFISQKQADNSKQPYLYYGCLAPKASENYTIENSPDAYYGVEACNMDLGSGEWAPESRTLQYLWSVNSIEQLPKMQFTGTFADGDNDNNSVFIALPPDRQWPYITAFKGDDGTCGVFEITKVQDRKIHIRYKILANLPKDGLIIERQLYASGLFDNDLFDFRTNTVFEIPGDLKFWDYPKWYAEQGIDVICIPAKQGPTLSGDGRVSGSFGHYGGNLCKFVKTELGMDSAAADLDNAWETGESMETIEHSGWDNLPARFFFKSRSGDAGILEITHIDDLDRTITFKYKLFRSSQAKNISSRPDQETDVQTGAMAQTTSQQSACKLEFRIVPQTAHIPPGEFSDLQSRLEANQPEKDTAHYVWRRLDETSNIQDSTLPLIQHNGKTWLLLLNNPEACISADGTWGLLRTGVTEDQLGSPAVDIVFNEAGANRFYELTSRFIDQQLAILIDDKVISAPRINSPIRNRAIITGRFTSEQAEQLADALQKGMPSVVPSPQSPPKIDLTPTDFKLHFDPKRLVYRSVVSIHNTGSVPLPRHRVRFYRGDSEQNLDETGHPHSGWHEAGPIEPGKSWNETTDGFNLPDGDYTFTVILDYDNAVTETDETNNRKTINIKIKNGQIIEKKPEVSRQNTEEHSRIISVYEWPRISLATGGYSGYGSFSIRPWDERVGTFFSGQWDKVEPVDGKIIIPSGQALKLDIYSGNNTDLALLDAFAPEDIQVLAIPLSNQIKTGAMPHIGRLTGLEALFLGGAAIQDEEIKHLIGLKQIKALHLQDCPLTDSAVEYLTKLKSLQYLNLWGTAITKKGYRQLTKQLPLCDIQWEEKLRKETVAFGLNSKMDNQN